jgi:hypothetical protein
MFTMLLKSQLLKPQSLNKAKDGSSMIIIIELPQCRVKM